MLDEKSLRVATRWLYDNRHTGYWTYPVLLGDTVDSKVRSLNLTDDEASAVFDTLEELAFLKKMEGRTKPITGIERQMYRVNYAKVREYYEFAHPHFYYHWFSDCVVYTIEKYWTWILAAIALILTSFFAGWLGAIGEGLAK